MRFFSVISALCVCTSAANAASIDWSSINGWWSFADSSAYGNLVVAGQSVTTTTIPGARSIFSIQFDVNSNSLKAFGKAATFSGSQMRCMTNFFAEFDPSLNSFNGTWVSTPQCTAPSNPTITFVRAQGMYDECGDSARIADRVSVVPRSRHSAKAAAGAIIRGSDSDANLVSASLARSAASAGNRLRSGLVGASPAPGWAGLWSASIPNAGGCYLINVVLTASSPPVYNATVSYAGTGNNAILGAQVIGFTTNGDLKTGYGRGDIFSEYASSPTCTSDVYVNLDRENGAISTVYQNDCSGNQATGNWVYSSLN